MASGLNFKLYDPVAQIIASSPFLPLAGGTMTGQITQPLDAVNLTDVVNRKSILKGFIGYRNFNPSSSLIIPANGSVKNFSNGYASVENVAWPGTDGVTFTMAGTGILTITSTLPYNTYYKSTFVGTGLNSSTNSDLTVLCSLYNDTTSSTVSTKQTLRCLAGPEPQFNNTLVLMNYFEILANGSIQLSIVIENDTAIAGFLTQTTVTNPDTTRWTIERLN